MTAGLRSRLGRSLGAVRAAFANPDMRRAQIAWFGGNLGHDAYFLAISIYAFERGGAGAVGIAAVARMAPAALASPFASALADRYPRRAVMVASDLSRALVLAALAAAIFASAPLALAVALAALAGVLMTPFEPAKAALMPSLARTPEELTAANVASSTAESVSLFLGPALAGAILALAGPGQSVLFAVAALLWSAFFLVRIEGEGGSPEAGTEADGEQGGDERANASLLRETAAGFGAIAADRRLALVVGLIAAQTFVLGALGVLVVVLALEMLGTGEGGVGFLNAAVGIGAVIGSGLALGLVGNRRLGRALGLGTALWGAPLIAIGLLADETAAVAMLIALGAANTIVDVSALTLLQRIAPERVLARVFGVLETLIIVSIALGSLLVVPLIDLAGNEAAFVAFGALLPLAALASWGALARIDREAPAASEELALLEAVPLFAPLGPAALEGLVGRLERERVRAGEAIVNQGEPGERFYVVAAGEIEVAVDRRHVRREGRGAHFGEIALLRDVPRTATVTAHGEVELLSLRRGDFLDAVGGHPRSSAAAEAVIASRLRVARPATV